MPCIRHTPALHRAAWVLSVALFLAAFAAFHIPGKGMTALIMFGDEFAATRLAELEPVDYHSMENSAGYDGQFYAQLAVRPRPGDPALAAAIDNPPFRARRILFCWTAWALGLGRPAWILHVYALQNIAAWLALAWVLRRWFPATGWGSFGRWFGVLFSFGLFFSVRASLLDGPGLLLVAAGMILLETNRPWLAAVVLGAGGLGKETGVLAAAALARPVGNWRDGCTVAARGVLVAAPLLLWLAYLVHAFGSTGIDSAPRNFEPPFVALWNKLVLTLQELRNDPPIPALQWSSLAATVSLVVQFLFFALRPRWRDPWWRLGASYALLFAFLGEAVWEGHPGATSRVALPLLLAFNIAVPAGRRWLPVLLLGNLTVLTTPLMLAPPATDVGLIEGPPSLVAGRDRAHAMRATFDGGWHQAERTARDAWRWTRGPAALVIHNPHSFPVRADLSCQANGHQPRQLRISVGDREAFRAVLGRARTPVRLKGLVLPPGDTTLTFGTDLPAERSGHSADLRPLAVRIYDLKLQVTGAQPAR